MSTRRRRTFGPLRVETARENKTLFSDPSITKGELIDYYLTVSKPLLRWLRDRPVALERYPDGIDAEGFYQKQRPESLPPWVTAVRVRKVGGGAQELVVCDKQATLAALANLGCVTLHPWLSRRDRLEHPDQLLLDLDPPPGAPFSAVRRAARACRDLLQELGLPSFLKATGSRGLHVWVPLDRSADFDTVRQFARDAMQRLAVRHPDALTTQLRKADRAGRVFLDTTRNASAQTAVAPYSVRPLPGAPVAAPLAWEELDHVHARSYGMRDMARRIDEVADPWRSARRRARSLRGAARRLEHLRGREAT